MIKGLLEGVLHTGVSKGVSLCTGLLLTVLLARSLTPEEYGVYGLIGTSMWLLPPALGLMLSTYLTRAVPGRTPAEQVALLKVTLVSEFVMAAGLAVLLVVSGLLGAFVEQTRVIPYYSLFAGVLVLGVLNTIQAELVQFAYGKVEIKTANYMDLVQQSAWVALLLVASLFGRRIDLFVIVGAMLAGSVLSSAMGLRLVDWALFVRTPFDRRTLRLALAYSVPLIVPSMNYGLLRFVDRFFLASVVNMRDLGFYTFATTLVNLVFTLSYRIFSSVAQPYIVQAHNLDDRVRRDLLLTYLLKASLLLFVIGIVLLLTVAYPLFMPFVRPEYAASAEWVIWIAATHVLLILNFPGQLLLSLQHRTRLIMGIEVTGALLVILLSAILIPRMGIWGGIASSWVAWAFVAGAYFVASNVSRVIVWRRLWTWDEELRLGRSLVAALTSR